MNKALNYLAVAVAASTHVLVGVATASLGKAHVAMVGGAGMELPVLSRMIIPYLRGVGPIAVGGLLGLITLVGIGYAARSERGVAYLPILLTVSFVLAIMHIVMVWYGTSMPLFRMSFELSK